MATLLDGAGARSRTPRPPGSTPRRPSRSVQLAVGVAAAIRSAGFSLLPLAVVVLVGWAGAGGGGASAGDALRVTADAWMLGHGIDLDLAGRPLRLAPLGLAVLPLLSLVVGATVAVRASGARSMRQCLPTVAGLTVTYTALVVGVAVAAGSASSRPSVPGAVVWAIAYALLGSAVGAARTLRRRPQALPSMPPGPGLVLAGATTALCVVLAAGGLLVTGSLLLHASEAVAAARSLHAGPLGGLLLLGLGVLLLPNAVVFAAAYAVGPGFAIGAGTTVAPSGVVLGPLPDLPLLVALPGPGAAPAGSLLVLCAPLLAGAAAGVVVARRSGLMAAPRHRGADRAAGIAALSGLGAALALGLLCLLSGGAAGSAQLSSVGPSAVRVTLAAAGELSLVAAAVAWWLVHRATGRARPGAGPASASGATSEPACASRDVGTA